MAVDTRETRTPEEILGMLLDECDATWRIAGTLRRAVFEKSLCAAYLIGANETRKALEAAAKSHTTIECNHCGSHAPGCGMCGGTGRVPA
jgi:RNase P subunit RPR2